MSEDDNRVPSALVAVGTKALAVRSETLIKRGLALAKSLAQLESGHYVEPGKRTLSLEESKKILDWVKKTEPVGESGCPSKANLESKGKLTPSERQALLEAMDEDFRYSAMAHVNLGIGLGKKGDFDGEFAEYREALRLDPDCALAHHNIAAVLGNNKADWDGAIPEFREALRLNPNLAVAHDGLGIALRNKGDMDGAIAEHREALRLNPGHAQTHHNLGVALGEKGDWDGAIAEYSEALRLNPSDAGPHTSLGVELYHKGDLDGAIAEYREAIRLTPDLAEAHYNLGIALEHKHNFQDALEEYRTACALNPQNAHFRRAYERLLQQRNK